METLQERFRGFVQTHGLLSPGDRVVLGFSGGADSACLLLLLAEEAVEVIAAHLDHRLRKESSSEADRCREMAASLGVEFVSESVDVRALAEREGIGLEEAGREARYEFFERTRRRVGAHLVATAHTLDDHVETMLLNLARGSGLRGLCGIPVRRGVIVRPLLFARKAETEAFCRARGVEFIRDPSNFDESHARVRARRELLPAFERLHPGALESAARTAWLLRDEDQFLDSLARFELSASREVRQHPLGRWACRYHMRCIRQRLASLPVALRRRVVMLALRDLGGSPTFVLADQLSDALVRGERFGVNVEGGVLAQVTDAAFVVKATASVVPFDQRLEVPGVVSGPGWRIVATCGALPRGVGRRSLEQSVCASVDTPLRVRLADRGDRITIGSREVSVFSSLKADGIPQEARARLPVVADSVGVLWAPGVGVAARARPKQGEGAFHLRFEVT